MGFVTSQRPCGGWWQGHPWSGWCFVRTAHTVCSLCKINSYPKSPSPLPCVPVLRGWCVSLCPPREVTPLLGHCGLAVTVVCTELLKCTFQLVPFIAVLNCLFFPCVLAHYFLLIHGLCNYLGNAGELAGIWGAWLLFLEVDDFFPCSMGGLVLALSEWQVAHPGFFTETLQDRLAVWREVESARSRERV